MALGSTAAVMMSWLRC
ncbi:hypothetical protein LEMLEM_LOCUS12622 [Lemmus lemmus]